MTSFSRNFTLLTGFALAAASCSTAGAQLEGSSPSSLSFAEPERSEQPVTDLDDSEEPPPSTLVFDPDVVGPSYDVAEPGPTLAVSGADGVWWFDANGQAHLVVEPAVAADYDGDGGLVFQRSSSSPIVRRTAEAEEFDLVAAGDGERVELVGVADVDGTDEVVYLRHSGLSVQLERATLDDGIITSIAAVERDGFAPERMSISGNYVSGVYLGGAGAGWVTLSVDSGSKLFGTTDDRLGECDDRAADCTEAVTVSPDGTTVYQVTGDEDTDDWRLSLHDASDFSELASVQLPRPVDGWHPSRVELLGANVLVSRSANPDGTGDLPALVIAPSSGDITQLDRAGTAVAVSG